MVPYDNLLVFARMYLPSGSTCRAHAEKKSKQHVSQQTAEMQSNLSVLHEHLITCNLDVIETKEAVVNHLVSELGANIANSDSFNRLLPI